MCNVPGGTLNVYGGRCDFKDGKLHIWLYKIGFRGGILVGSTSADSTTAEVFMELSEDIDVETPNFYGIKQYGNTLSHEIGHDFTLPDYYFERVNSTLNYVVPISITPYIKDIMYNRSDYMNFSPTSREYVNRVTTLPTGFGSPYWEVQYSPKETILKIMDDSGSSLAGIKVEVFRQQPQPQFGFNQSGIISTSVTFEGFTDTNGEFSLGDYTKMLGTPPMIGSGHSVFLRITNGEVVRYTALTRSYLNALYFNGNQDRVVLPVKFTDLLEYRPNTYQEISSPPVSMLTPTNTPSPAPTPTTF